MKVCTRCGEEKKLTEFHKDKSTTTGRKAWCKVCVREQFQTLRKNTDRYRERCEKYKETRDRIREAMPNHNWAFTAYHNAKKRAKAAEVPFALSKEWLVEQVSFGVCPLLGIPFSYSTGKSCASSPTVDRKVPDLGYTEENCWVISHKANRIKSNATLEEVKLLVANWERMT